MRAFPVVPKAVPWKLRALLLLTSGDEYGARALARSIQAAPASEIREQAMDWSHCVLDAPTGSLADTVPEGALQALGYGTSTSGRREAGRVAACAWMLGHLPRSVSALIALERRDWRSVQGWLPRAARALFQDAVDAHRYGIAAQRLVGVRKIAAQEWGRPIPWQEIGYSYGDLAGIGQRLRLTAHDCAMDLRAWEPSTRID